MRRFALTMVLLGCTQPDPAPLVTPDPYCSTQIANGVVISASCDGQHDQGRFLLGIAADALAANNAHISVVEPRMTVDANRNVLINNIPVQKDHQFSIVEGAAAALRIDSISGAYYQLSYQMPGSTTWLPYCTNNEPAFAMAGQWSTSGLHDLAPDHVTFACITEGKAGKCQLWGYIPGSAGPTAGDRGWDLHQVCTQAARADYCMDGHSHTREKTPIMLRDLVAGYGQPDWQVDPMDYVPSTYPPVPPPPDNYYVEGFWAPRRPVRCLSKLRWNDQKPGGPCPDQLFDPRQDPRGKFCEDLLPGIDFPDEGTTASAADHRMITASPTMDLALHRWQDASLQTVTTVHGYIVPKGFSAPKGYDHYISDEEYFLLRNLPGTLDQTDVIWVYRLKNGSDEIVAPLATQPGFNRTSTDLTTAAPDFEGYLLKPGIDTKGEQTAPLFLWVNDSGGDYVTSVTQPIGSYSKVRGIGYMGRDSLGDVITGPP
jgi:hypothetical protein